MSGLLNYLLGPGRANEHENPHLIAGDDALMERHGGRLTQESAAPIARHLDRPRKALGVEVAGGHVWHCSLSLRADEGKIADETWRAIAEDFIREMGFDDNEGTKAACRWVAVHHGASKNGNDHIHIVVDLVREDGTKASIHNDRPRAQKTARRLETKYGLEELESVRAERATRGYDPAEREAQARSRARSKYERTRAQADDGRLPWENLGGDDRRSRIAAELRTDQPRYLLALKVRGCAAASSDEGEFVRRMRRDGLLVRPRFADGSTELVVGYSVAERPQFGERPIWYGGGHLGRDLTLPRLRDGWTNAADRGDAVAEWTAARRGRRTVTVGREADTFDDATWTKRNEELGALVEKLRDVGIDDRDTWVTVARQTSGALSAWSNATEQAPGDLAAAAEALSRSAQTYRRPLRPQKVSTAAISGAAMLLASATHGGQGHVAQAAMMRSFIRLTDSVIRVAQASRDERHARIALTDARTRLERVHAGLPKPVAVATAPQATTPAWDAETQARLDRVRLSFAQPATKAMSPKHRPAPRPGTKSPRPRTPFRRPGQDGPER